MRRSPGLPVSVARFLANIFFLTSLSAILFISHGISFAASVSAASTPVDSFDINHMLNNLCEDAGISVRTNIDAADPRFLDKYNTCAFYLGHVHDVSSTYGNWSLSNYVKAVAPVTGVMLTRGHDGVEERLGVQYSPEVTEGIWQTRKNNASFMVRKTDGHWTADGWWNGNQGHYIESVTNGQRERLFYVIEGDGALWGARVSPQETTVLSQRGGRESRVWLGYGNDFYQGTFNSPSDTGGFMAYQTGGLWGADGFWNGDQAHYRESLVGAEKERLFYVIEGDGALWGARVSPQETTVLSERRGKESRVWLGYGNDFYQGTFNSPSDTGGFMAYQTGGLWGADGFWNGDQGHYVESLAGGDIKRLFYVKKADGALLGIQAQKTAGLWEIDGLLNGGELHYREMMLDGRKDMELELVRKDGTTTVVGRDDVTAIAHGNMDRVFHVLKTDFNTDLSFDTSFSGGDVSFSQADRLLSAHVQGHAISLNLGSSPFLLYDSPGGNMHFKLAPRDHGVDLAQAYYRDAGLVLNLDNTFINYDARASVLGLYGRGNYLVKVAMSPEDQLRAQAGSIYDAIRSGDMQIPSADTLIRTHIQQVTINFREISSGGYVAFSDPAWNSLMTSLAWDVPEGTLSGDDVARVVGAQDRNGELYATLNGLLGENPGASLTRVEKSLSFELANSIMAPDGASALKPLGVTSLAGSTSMSFTPFLGSASSASGRAFSSFSAGQVDIAIPGMVPYGRTLLTSTAYAERYAMHLKEDFLGGGGSMVSTGMLLYAYRFPGALNLSLQDGFSRRFSTHMPVGGVSFGLDNTSTGGTVIPGMMLSSEVRDEDGRWHLSYKSLPYLPVTVDQSMAVSLGTGQDVFSRMSSLGWTDDIRGGVKGALGGQEAAFDAGRDVNGYLFAAPSLTFMDRWTVGVETRGRDVQSPELMTYHTGLKTGVIDPTLFWEKNTSTLTDTYGLSFDRASGKNKYNVSTGLTTWDNNGLSQVVEHYVSVGLSLNDRLVHTQGVALNEIEQSVRWATSSSLGLDKDGDRRVVLETGLVRGNVPEGEVLLRMEMAF